MQLNTPVFRAVDRVKPVDLNGLIGDLSNLRMTTNKPAWAKL